MKHFEAYVGQWLGWTENDKCKITRKGNLVTVVFENPEGQKFKTIVNLDIVAMYTISA